MRFFLIIFLLFITLFANSQITISGFVYDAQSGEKMIGATVLDEFSRNGCITNVYGFYSLKIPNTDSAKIYVSYTGYEKYTFRPDTLSSATKNIKLSAGILLKTTEITASRIENTDNAGNIRLPIKTIKSLPALGGEVDLMKAIQMMPGVNSGSEGTSNVLVRGGGQDQNLIVLDDVPLYYVNHLFGFMSVFNTDAINSVEIFKSDFPAKYGGRLSSVIDVRMKDGNTSKWNASGMLGLLSSKIYVDGPIKKDKITFMVSARRMLLDLITKPFTKASFGAAAGYYFYDINSKLQWKISDKDFIFLSFYNGDDKFGVKDKKSKNNLQKINTQWGNFLFSTRWNHVWNKKLFSNLTLSTSRFRYDLNSHFKYVENNVEEVNTAKFYSGIRDYMGNFTFDYFAAPSHQFTFGTNFIFHKFTPSQKKYYMSSGNFSTDTIMGNNLINSFDYSAFAEYQLKLNKFKLKPGIRSNFYSVEKTKFISFEPRLLINYNIKKARLFFSIAQMQQNIHLLSSSGIGMPYDLWLPATKIAKPASAKQISLGFNTEIFKNMPLSCQVYYKSMKNMIMYKEGTSILSSANNWESVIEIGGKGNSYGMEIMIEKNIKNFNGWLSYTLSKTDRKFNNLNFGKSFPFVYDNRHIINISGVYNINENISVSASWNFKTGNAITLASGKYYMFSQSNPDYPNEIHYYNGLNNLRMRSYHRLDIGANFSKKKKWGTRTWSVSIYNLYNRKNPYYYYFASRETGKWENGVFIKDKGYVLKQKSLFPILPSVNYTFTIGK